MKKSVLLLIGLLAMLALPARAANQGGTPQGNSINVEITPAVFVATNTTVAVSHSAGTEMTGNVTPTVTQSAAGVITPVWPAASFISNIDIQNEDGSNSIFCGYNSNVATSGSAQGFRICAAAAAEGTVASCPTDHTFSLLPYQQLFCISANGSGSTAVVLKWH